jgi:hypothetical protein
MIDDLNKNVACFNAIRRIKLKEFIYAGIN